MLGPAFASAGLDHDGQPLNSGQEEPFDEKVYKAPQRQGGQQLDQGRVLLWSWGPF